MKNNMKRIGLAILTLLLCLPTFAALKAVKNNKTNKWGFQDPKTLRTVIKHVYDEVDPAHSFIGSKDYAVVRQGKYWGVINTEGDVIAKMVFKNKNIAFKAAHAQWRKARIEDYIYDAADANGKFGYANYYGDWVISPLFDEIDDTYTLSGASEYAIVKYKGLWGAIDADAKYIIKPVMTTKESILQAAKEWGEYAPLGLTSYEAMDSQTRKKGFANYLGNWIVKPFLDDYDKTCMFTPDRNFAVVKRGGKWGCLDRGEKWIVQPAYATAAEAKKAGFAWQLKNPKAGTRPSEAHNIDDGKFKNSLFASAPAAPSTPSTPLAPSVNPQKPAQPAAAGAPTITIVSPKDGAQYTNPEMTFVYQAKTADGSKPTIAAYINGELQPTTKGVKQLSDQITLTLPRKEDVCRVQLIAKDSKGLSSDPAVVRLYYKADQNKPALHVVSIGVSDYDQADLKLQHASKDAADFLSAVQNSNLTYYKNLATASLVTDKNANDRTIKKQLSQLVNKVDQGDVILLYFSGHGAKEGDETYFLSANAESEDLFSTAVNFDVIRSATKRLKDKRCKIIIFMDACHSGAMYGQKSVAEPFSLADPGIIGFYSSTASQKSNESEEWKNGIFTKALIEGINGKAVDEEGNITIDGLEKYIRQQVRTSTNGKQMPIFENKQGNYILFPKRN